MADYPNLDGPHDLGLGDQPTRPEGIPLSDVAGHVPSDARILGREIGDGPAFAQYLIAVGATGEPDKEVLAKAFYDTGMQFAQAAGVEPLLAVGYRSETAHPADYLDAAKVWHHHMSDLDHDNLRNALPKLYVALSLLFGQRR